MLALWHSPGHVVLRYVTTPSKRGRREDQGDCVRAPLSQSPAPTPHVRCQFFCLQRECHVSAALVMCAARRTWCRAGRTVSRACLRLAAACWRRVARQSEHWRGGRCGTWACTEIPRHWCQSSTTTASATRPPAILLMFLPLPAPPLLPGRVPCSKYCGAHLVTRCARARTLPHIPFLPLERKMEGGGGGACADE